MEQPRPPNRFNSHALFLILVASKVAMVVVPHYYPKKVTRDAAQFSARHPMVPTLYVPAWQLDMKNRKLILQVRKKLASPSQLAKNS